MDKESKVIEVGYWYTVKKSSQLKEYSRIKIVPVSKLLESQPSGVEYYNAIGLNPRGKEIFVFTYPSSLEEIVRSVNSFFDLEELTSADKYSQLLSFLDEDSEYLSKGVHQRSKEIAVHMQNLCGILKGCDSDCKRVNS